MKPDSRPNASSPAPVAAGDIDALYASGTQAFALGQFDATVRCATLAAAIEPGLAPVHYLLGMALFALGRHAEAVTAMELVEHGRAAYPLSSHLESALALARARRDIALGRCARHAPAPATPHPSVSPIICSVRPALLRRAVDRFRVLLGDTLTEVIHIDDARSLCEGYNRGAGRAAGELLLFSHDDINVVSDDFASILFDTLAQNDFFGVAGSTQLAGPAWNSAGWACKRGQVAWPHGDGRLTVSVFGPGGRLTPDIQVIDGLFFACRGEVFARVRFDEKNFDGWNLYDLDFCHAVWKAGFRTCVRADMLISHDSSGSYGPDWQRYADRFIDKWRDGLGTAVTPDAAQLPQSVLQSAAEWRLFAQHLFDARDAALAGSAD